MPTAGTTGSRPTARPAPRPERGGAWSRRGAAGHARECVPGPSARAFPARSPASCVLWSRPPPLPCWILRPAPPPPPPPPEEEEEWRRSWEFSAVARVRGQRPSGPSLAGRQLGAFLTRRGPPPTPPSRGLLRLLLLPAPEELRDAAPLTPLLPPLSPRGGTSFRPLAGGDGPGLRAPPARP